MSPSNAPRLLVTGATGFVGRHLASAVAAGVFGELEFVPAPADWDIRDADSSRALVAEVKPAAVIHLAAQSFVPRSFEAPRETFEINLLGTLGLLQALAAERFTGRMVYVSSGDVYGKVPDESLPVGESRMPEPRSPYGVSKFAAEQLCLQWHRSEGLDVVVARPFNHVGPGQLAQFVLPALARQVVAIAQGRQPPVIEAGDIDTTRDFSDVRDIVAAYAAMLRAGVPGRTYVVGSGIERRVRDLLAEMCRIEGIAPRIEQDPARMRPAEQRRMAADSRLLRADTGWAPAVPLHETLNDILEEARRIP